MNVERFKAIFGKRTFDDLPFEVRVEVYFLGRIAAGRSSTMTNPKEFMGVIGRMFIELHFNHFTHGLV